MTASVYDFKAMAAAAQLKRLDGHNQNETPTPAVEMPCDSNPQDSEYFYGTPVLDAFAAGYTAPEQDGA